MQRVPHRSLALATLCALLGALTVHADPVVSIRVANQSMEHLLVVEQVFYERHIPPYGSLVLISAPSGCLRIFGLTRIVDLYWELPEEAAETYTDVIRVNGDYIDLSATSLLWRLEEPRFDPPENKGQLEAMLQAASQAEEPLPGEE